LIHFVDEANNAPVSTNWAEWKRKLATRSPLYGDILEYFRASAFERPRGEKIVHNLIDRQDKKYFWTPLHWAAVAGRVETMDILVHNGADPLILSNLNANILHSAAESKLDTGLAGALNIWRRCSDRLNINQQNRWLETPLHVASWCSAACVKLLLEAGALPGIQQEDGQVPLHCAGLVTSPGRSSIATLLCETEGRSHINTQDVDGRPPLFDFLDDAECVTILLHHDARLDFVDTSGRSSIHHCCYHGYSASLKLLLRSMDDKTLAAAKDLNGNTALMEALSCSMRINPSGY
jgi:ankyrin repeat protein